MNKKKLFKTIMITLLILIGLTWIITTGSYSEGVYTAGSVEPLGLWDLFYLPFQSFQTFVQYGLFILIVGGFYGVLNKTEVYDNVIKKIAKKYKTKKTLFLAITVITLAVLSSLIGIPVVLFALVPFFKDILETMGYDKKNVMLATIGAIFIGIIGSTFSFEINGYINYFYKVGYTSLLIVKAVLLILLSTILIIFIAKNNKEFNEQSLTVTKTKKAFPMVIISIILFLIAFIGIYGWYYGFNIEFFNDLHTSISEITIDGFPILSSILGKNMQAIGNWGEIDFGILLLIGSLVIGWMYNLKFKDIFDGFTDGAKKLIPMSLFLTLSFVIFMPIYTSQTGTSIMYTIYNSLIKTAESINIFSMSLLSAIATFFYGQFSYFSSDLAQPLMTTLTETSTYPLMTLIMQTIYGLTLMITPTSMLLLGGLSYFDVSYKDWMKHIFKFVLIALAILIVTFFIIGWLA